MRRCLMICCLIVITGMWTAQTQAQPRMETIAAVVNQDAISMSDVNDRMGLFIASAGLPNSKDIRQKLLGQVLGSLIEEQLKLQEADRLGLEVSAQEIANGFAALAGQNNMKADQFRAMLRRGGLNVATMERQIRAQIAWSKVIQSEMHPRVVVSDKDIDNALERLRGHEGEYEYRAAEIFLPVGEDGQTEQEARQLAGRLIGEIEGGKTPFFQIAQEFSKAAGAAAGGDLGWVQKGQLTEELDRALLSLEKGALSPPIRTPSGVHILLLVDKRRIGADTLPSRQQIMSDLGLQRLERLQRRYLMDLKAAAFVENRLAS